MNGAIRTMIILLFCMTIHSQATRSAEGLSLRSITVMTYHDYEGRGPARIAEETAIVGVHPSWAMIVQGYHDDRKSWSNTIGRIAAVYIFDRHHYLEAGYGEGNDSDDKTSRFHTVEFTRETARYIAAVGYRYASYPTVSYHTLSPSLRVQITQRYSLLGKIFGSRDQDGNINYALWMDGSARVSSRHELHLGFTVGDRLYAPEYEYHLQGKANMGFWSLIPGYDYRVSPRAVIKYRYEQLRRQKKYTDRKHVLILDFRI